MEPSISKTPTIKVATFNLLQIRDPTYIEEVAQELVDTESDIIAIQECTKLNTEVLIRSFKKRGYQYTRFDQLSIRKDGEIMFYLSSVVIKKKEYTSFVRSNESRGLSKYLVQLKNGSEVWVVTSQLEMQNGVRKIQVKEIGMLFGGAKIPIIFAGDTNIPAWQDVGVPPGWEDAWREHGTNENEKTTDHDRMDQIWYKNPDDKNTEIRCLEFDQVGSTNRRGVFANFEVV